MKKLIDGKKYEIDHKNFVQSMKEGFIGWSLFIIVWNTREIIENDALICLGIAYLFIGGLHLCYTLSFKGMGILGTQLQGIKGF